MIAGPSGTGKSHLVEALAHAAIEKDLRVAWFTLETLTAAIGRAKADGSVARTVTRICRADLIVVDDIGMLPAGQDAAEAFYRITDAAYERRSLAVTSNIHPSGFDTIMPKTLATAEYVDWFNTGRLHTAIGGIPPAEHEAAYYAQPQPDPEAGSKT